MLAVVRSGLVEARHEVVAVAVDDTGTVVASLGDYLDRRFFYRSAIKPLQALVSQANGADLGPEETAVAASSHGGHPVHLAYVRSMLVGMGLGVDHLLCPADRPLSPVADRRAAVGGSLEAARIFHNCSGKHAAMLRACVAKGWSTDYLPAEHPLQQQVVAVVSDAAGEGPWATGVDGCGVPTVAGTVGGLARAFARLAVDPTMVGVRDAMCRFSALTSERGEWRGGSVSMGSGRREARSPGMRRVGASGLRRRDGRQVLDRILRPRSGGSRDPLGADRHRGPVPAFTIGRSGAA